MNLAFRHRVGRRLRAVAPALLVLALAAAASTLSPPRADALVRLDFEQPFFRIPGREIWDFCAVRVDSVYHIFYIDVAEEAANNKCDWLGHATSTDLVHWTVHAPAVTTGQGWWDDWSVWAPHVVRDDANDRWVMAYTGVDSLKVQRACMAYSDDLWTWTREPANPVFEPDSLAYFWSPTQQWSSFRDPFLYREDGVWNMLNTAGLRHGGYPGFKQAIVHRATSTDLVTWTDQGSFFANDGSFQTRDIESVQYVQRNGLHHLFFTEYLTGGVSHVAAADRSAWTMDTRRILDDTAAPEMLDFDGIDVLGRYATYQHPSTGNYSFVLRFDTLQWSAPDSVDIVKPHPLDRDWAVHTGTANLGNPVFGDNPVERGDPSAGPVGTFSYGSQEYYLGPQSGVGAPGAYLGDFATGLLESRPFVLEGDWIQLLVGGGDYPATCFVALVDADADTVVHAATGTGVELMTQRLWDIRPQRGMNALIRIVDQETGAMGHICVDEIEEIIQATGVMPRPLPAARAVPNPFNPSTEIRFTLGVAQDVRLRVHDMRGRIVWTSPVERLGPGPAAITWNGQSDDGRSLPSGAYVFRLDAGGRAAASGRLTLLR